MSEYILQVQNIIKDFTGVRAINDVSFSVRENEIMGLIGENGAGKSTMLKIINGVYRHGSYEGKILLNGAEVRFNSSLDALKQGIGFVPQEISVMENLTVAENIFVGHLKEKGGGAVTLKQIIKRAAGFLQQHAIRLDPAEKVCMLSIAQKQMLMIAKALSREPQILILDEPTTALAIDDVKNLFDMVRQLKKAGKSIVLVTHKLDEILTYTDSVVIMRDGSMVASYRREEYAMDRIISDMVGRTITNIFPSRNAQIGEEILRVEGLRVAHPKIKNRSLITDVSLRLRRGEVLGLVGLVGSGRTETLETIFGRNRLESGTIWIDGKQVKIRSVHDAIRQGINLVTEDRKESGILKLANIKNNIIVSNLKKVCSGGIIRKKKEIAVAQEYMQTLSVKAPDYQTMVVNLSGGNQQKVVVAKALNTNPSILLLDEPTKGIDVGSKNEIYNLINRLAESGMAIILVSSELPEIMAMSDRFVVLAGGRVVDEVCKQGATQENLMEKCFA